MNINTNSPIQTDREEPRLGADGHDAARPELGRSAEPSSTVQPIADVSTQLEQLDSTDSVPDEQPRSGAIERGDTRLDAAEREGTRTDAVVRDGAFVEEREEVSAQNAAGIETALQDIPKREAPTQQPIDQETNWLDVEQAAELLKERGISRTIRTIQKMCKRGDLNARLVPTENGVRYIISDLSIDEFVERHNEKLPSGGFEPKAINDDVVVEQNSNPTNVGNEPIEVNAPTSQTEQNPAPHLKEIIELKDQHIAMLQSQVETANTQIAVKDEQIGAMLERDHETNVLIQNLQNLVALPEGRSTQNERTGSIDVNHQSEHRNSQHIAPS